MGLLSFGVLGLGVWGFGALGCRVLGFGGLRFFSQLTLAKTLLLQSAVSMALASARKPINQHPILRG